MIVTALGDTGAGMSSSTETTLIEIERRVLWLATRMIDAANRDRAAPGAPPGREAEFHVKVGGHQASCASMVGIMTALWFGHLRGADKVAVKPHVARLPRSSTSPASSTRRTSAVFGLRRPSGISVADQGSRRRRLLDRVGWPRRDGPLFAAGAEAHIESHFGR